MYSGFPILISFIPLSVMVFSDFRDRRISVYGLVIFAVTAWLSAWLYLGGATLAGHLKTNIAFLALLYLSLKGYTRLIRPRGRSSLTWAIGVGDLLFLPALSPFFELREFVIFLTAAFLFSLGVYGCSFVFRRMPMKTIPLVGTVGICFMIYIPVMLWIR